MNLSKLSGLIILAALVLVGAVGTIGANGCSTGGAAASGSTKHAAALALVKAMSFTDGSLQNGAVPDATADMVTLLPIPATTVQPGIEDALLSFDIDNPDEANDPAQFALLQFGDAGQYYKVKLGKAATDGGAATSDASAAADAGDASAAGADAGGDAGADSGTRAPKLRVGLHYGVEDFACDQLCDTTFTLDVVQAVARKSGTISAHAKGSFTLDCTTRGKHALCGAADSSTTTASSAMGGATTSPDGVLAVVVSPGAITGAPLALTVTRAGQVPKGTIGQVYELGPSGTHFAKPVSVQYSYANLDLGTTDPKSLRLATLDTTGKIWQPLAANQVDTARQVVSGDTLHFSPFGLIGGGSSSGTSDGGTSSGTGPLGFTPSNVDLSGLDLSTVGDVVVSGNNCDLYSESQMWACVADTLFAKKIVTLPDQSRVSLFVVKSLRIEASTVMNTYEHLPIVIVALDTITLLGSVLVQPGTAGGAYNSGTQARVKGQGPGGGAAGTTDAAGGGGSFCGTGGRGATEGTAAGGKAKTYGSAALVPLQGGSAGGTGELVDSKGGGAIQFVAGTSFLLGPSAYINAGGSGGVNGGANHQEASGGGSGGAILIEAPMVTLSGVLAANGAGGGQGDGDSGANASADDQVALGGHRSFSGIVPSVGGNGSAARTINGSDGTDTSGYAAGGGGGGSGWIRVNSQSGQLDTTKATLSPAQGSACLSAGTLAP